MAGDKVAVDKTRLRQILLRNIRTVPYTSRFRQQFCSYSAQQ